MELIRHGYNESNNTQFFLEVDKDGNWILTIPMPIGGIGADVIHKLTEIDKLECENYFEEYLSKQIKLMQKSPDEFKIVSWR